MSIKLENTLISHILLQTPTHDQPVKTYCHQLCSDTGWRLEDLLQAMIDWDRLVWFGFMEYQLLLVI